MGRRGGNVLGVVSLATLAVAGCPWSRDGSSDARPAPASEPASDAADAGLDGAADADAVDAAPEPEPIDPAHLVVAFRDGQPAEMDDREIEAAGLTLIDLRDTWVPRVLRGTPELPSTYEKVYVDLANERGETVEDADPSAASYYLEVYGISPSLSTIKNRLEREQARPCFRDIDYELLRAFKGTRAYIPDPRETLKLRAQEFHVLERRIKRLMEEQGVERAEDITGNETVVRQWLSQSTSRLTLRAAQDRLACEKLFPGRGGYLRDAFDWPTHIALLNFERRHRFYGWGYFNEETAHALSWNPEETAFHTLRRALAERVMDTAGIIEDGSTFRDGKAPTYRGADGVERPVRNLEQEFTDAAMRHLGLDEPADAVGFLQGHDFSTLRVAVPLPEVPEYYAPHMDLYAVIDRGDVWYDFPYDEQGNEITQPIGRRPTLTLFTTFRDQKIALARYGTTIGGWRSTVRDGVEYWAYKNSDVGNRVWRNIVGAPSWIPPDSTPVRDLVAQRRRRGKLVTEANQPELGPGYASAYGLVMGINVQAVERDGETLYLDNGIRAHGSVNYQSIQKRHSHGCHRLHNHLALRLFGYVLAHRTHKRLGQEPATYGRVFEHEEKTYRLRVDTRGYFYEMEPAVPLTVTTGHIMGPQLTPITEYVIKPHEAERLRLEAEAAAQADAGAGAAPAVP